MLQVGYELKEINAFSLGICLPQKVYDVLAISAPKHMKSLFFSISIPC
jgi:hypothetical protein